MLYPKKYSGTRFNGELVEAMNLEEGECDNVSVHLFGKGPKVLATIPLYVFMNEAQEWSADYILCDIQDFKGLEVLK